MSQYGTADTATFLLTGVCISAEIANLPQGMFQLVFTHSVHGKENYLVSSGLLGEIKIWTVCPIKGLECIWQVRRMIPELQFVILS